MQHLANRYFNRAIFFLTTARDSDRQKEAEALGFRDLQIAADMDVEIVDVCDEFVFKINRVERYELMMIRVRGLLALAEIGYSPDELFVEDQINGVYQDLLKASKNQSHELFKSVSLAGRMQKLDVELIKYYSQQKDTTNAARAAIRMLIEDEYIFPEAEQEAVRALLEYVKADDDEHCPSGDIAKELELVIDMLEGEDNEEMERKSSSFTNSLKQLTSVDSSTSRPGSSFLRSMNLSFAEISDTRRSALKQSGRGDVTMELF